MEIENIINGRTMKSCNVLGAKTEDEALSAAMTRLGESKGSLFGWGVSYIAPGYDNPEGFHVVTLHTD